MSKRNRTDDIYFDANGRLTERVSHGDLNVVIHYDDIPESDITTVRGLRCTTALRTMIDIAVETDQADFKRIVRECLDRKLFSVADAMTRIAQPDMRSHPGAELLRQVLPRR